MNSAKTWRTRQHLLAACAAVAAGGAGWWTLAAWDHPLGIFLMLGSAVAVGILINAQSAWLRWTILGLVLASNATWLALTAATNLSLLRGSLEIVVVALFLSKRLWKYAWIPGSIAVVGLSTILVLPLSGGVLSLEAFQYGFYIEACTLFVTHAIVRSGEDG